MTADLDHTGWIEIDSLNNCIGWNVSSDRNTIAVKIDSLIDFSNKKNLEGNATLCVYCVHTSVPKATDIYIQVLQD